MSQVLGLIFYFEDTSSSLLVFVLYSVEIHRDYTHRILPNFISFDINDKVGLVILIMEWDLLNLLGLD